MALRSNIAGSDSTNILVVTEPYSASISDVIEPSSYCGSPSIAITWPELLLSHPYPQSAYQIQVDNNSNFSSPEFDTNKIISTTTEYTTSQIGYGSTSYIRLRLWNSLDLQSNWSNGVAFTPPAQKPPIPLFHNVPDPISKNTQISFADDSITPGTIVSWIWNFNCTITSQCQSSTASIQTPNNKFYQNDLYKIDFDVTDNIGQTCSITKFKKIGNTNNPQWIEVNPRR